MPPATGNERDAQMIREALSKGQRSDQLLDGRDFNEAPWDEAQAALDSLVAALSAATTERDKLAALLRELRDAEWMVTHDWGGDRDGLLVRVDAALAAAAPATTEEP